MPASVIAERIAAHRGAEDFVYLLVDPLAGCAPEHALSPSSLTATLGDDALVSVPRPDLAHTFGACPMLVRLAGPGQLPDAGLLGRTEQLAMAETGYRKRYGCGCLLSPLSADALAEHIAARCLTFSASASGGMSPWFEPLRLELLAAAMPDTLGSALWPIRTWLLPTSWGEIAMVSGAPGEAYDVPPIARDAQREAALIALLLAAWCRTLQTPLSFAPRRWQGKTMLPPQAAASAFRMIRRARQRGVTDNKDLLTLALHQETIHPQLLRFEPLRDALLRATPGHASGVLAAYGNVAWSRIAAYLNEAGESA